MCYVSVDEMMQSVLLFVITFREQFISSVTVTLVCVFLLHARHLACFQQLQTTHTLSDVASHMCILLSTRHALQFRP
jgi:hypothetical protein